MALLRSGPLSTYKLKRNYIRTVYVQSIYVQFIQASLCTLSFFVLVCLCIEKYIIDLHCKIC